MIRLSADTAYTRAINARQLDRTLRDGSSLMWHQPCQCISMDIQKTRHKKLVIHVQSHESAVSLLESGE